MHECHVYRLRSSKMATVSRPWCSLGPFCGEAGLSEQDLLKNNVENIPRLSQSTLLVNGILYELGLFRKRQKSGGTSCNNGLQDCVKISYHL